MKLDPYFIVGWVRLRDAAVRARPPKRSRRGGATAARDQSKLRLRPVRTLRDAIAYGRKDEARAALADIASRWPNDAAFAQTLLAWTLGEPGTDPTKLRAALADAPENEASLFLIANQDIDGYNADIQSRGAALEAYYFCNLYSSRPAGQAMLRDPRVKAKLKRNCFPAYWREKGWPAGCRPLGENDFECGSDTTSGK